MSRPTAPEPKSSRLRPICIGLALLTLLVYLPVRHHTFVRLDDADYVAANPMVQGGLSWAGIKWAFTSFHASNWHPLTWLSHMLDWELFGPFAGAHHVVNVLFHALNAVLLCVLWQRLTGALWPAALIAALFAWHPAHVESVAWVSERKDVLSACFFMLTLLAYERYGRSQLNPSGRTSLLTSGKGLTVVGLYALGLMAKPMLVTLPFVLMLLDYWPLRRYPGQVLHLQGLWRCMSEKLPLLILAVSSCALTYLAQRQEAVTSLEVFPLSLRVQNAILAYARYLGKTVWPVDLAVFYPMPTHFAVSQVLLAAGMLIGISIAVSRVVRSQPYLAIGWFWFLGTLVPVIGLVQVGRQAMADRYTYLPLIGLFIMLAFGGRHLIAAARLGKFAVGAGLALILVACGYGTFQQVQVWRDSETLFRHALKVTKDNAVAHGTLGLALAGKGLNDEAVQQFQAALKLAPDMPGVHNDLAIALQLIGKTNTALEHYQEARRLKPLNPQFHANLGLLLVQMGRYEEGLACYAEALRLDAGNPYFYFMRGKAHQDQGRSAAAAEDYRTALQHAPDDINCNLALCQLLAADPDPKIRNGAAAVILGERLNQLTGGGRPEIQDALAMAYAETGQFERAYVLLSNTLSQIPAADSNAFVGAMQARLKLYQARLPYRATPAQPPAASPPPAREPRAP